MRLAYQLQCLFLCIMPLLAGAGILDKPLPAQGLVLQYDIYLKNDKVGQHRIQIHN